MVFSNCTYYPFWAQSFYKLSPTVFCCFRSAKLPREWTTSRRILQFMELKSAAYNRERFQIKSDFKSTAISNQGRVIMACIRYLSLSLLKIFIKVHFFSRSFYFSDIHMNRMVHCYKFKTGNQTWLIPKQLYDKLRQFGYKWPKSTFWKQEFNELWKTPFYPFYLLAFLWNFC